MHHALINSLYFSSFSSSSPFPLTSLLLLQWLGGSWLKCMVFWESESQKETVNSTANFYFLKYILDLNISRTRQVLYTVNFVSLL